MLQDGYPYLPWAVSVPPPRLVARSLSWNMPTETSHHEAIQAEVTWGFSTLWSKTYHAATILRHCCPHMVPRRTIRGSNRDLGLQSWAEVGTVGARVGALKFCSTAEGTGGWLWETDLFSFHIRATLLAFHHSTSDLSLTLVVSPHSEVYLLVAAVLHGTPKDWLSQCTENTPKAAETPSAPSTEAKSTPTQHRQTRMDLGLGESLARCADNTVAPLGLVLVSHLARERDFAVHQACLGTPGGTHWTWPQVWLFRTLLHCNSLLSRPCRIRGVRKALWSGEPRACLAALIIFMPCCYLFLKQVVLYGANLQHISRSVVTCACAWPCEVAVVSPCIKYEVA